MAVLGVDDETGVVDGILEEAAAIVDVIDRPSRLRDVDGSMPEVFG